MSAIQDIQKQGWTQVSFDWSAEKRAHFTKLGNQVIDLMMQDEKLREAFSFVLGDFNDKRAKQANLFTVSPALNSADDKLWFHVGYQTRKHVDAVIPKKYQPPIVREFLDAIDEMLAKIERAFRQSLSSIGADDVATLIFDAEKQRRVIHIRIVRYNGARLESAPDEPVSGHADMSLCTLHIFETHGNWFQAAPYDQSIITDDKTPEREAAVRQMRQNLKLITEVDEQTIFFLGAGWKNLPHDEPPKEYQQLPACYHAGVRPPKEVEFVSPYAQDVVGDTNDRVSLVVFAQPSLDYVQDHEFKYATVAQCRPDTAVVV